MIYQRMTLYCKITGSTKIQLNQTECTTGELWRSRPHPLSGKTFKLFPLILFCHCWCLNKCIRQGDPKNQMLFLIAHNYCIVTIKSFQVLRDIWTGLTHSSRIEHSGCLWKELAQNFKWRGYQLAGFQILFTQSLGQRTGSNAVRAAEGTWCWNDFSKPNQGCQNPVLQNCYPAGFSVIPGRKRLSPRPFGRCFPPGRSENLVGLGPPRPGFWRPCSKPLGALTDNTWQMEALDRHWKQHRLTRLPLSCGGKIQYNKNNTHLKNLLNISLNQQVMSS